MAEAKDIVAISIPFVSGVAAAAVTPWGGESLYWGAAASCGASVFLLALLCRSGRRRAVAPLLYFSLGVMCRCSAMIACPVSALSDRDFAAAALHKLTRLLEDIPFPHSSTAALLKAVLTGQRGGLSAQTVGVFRKSGASHILALSGLHLGVIYALLSRILGLLGNSRTAGAARSALCVVACGFYAIMTGASPSIVRAFLFILLREISRHSPGRRRDPVRILCTALLLQLASDPMVLDSVGFQLSYLAMTGIFLLYPPLKEWYPQQGGKLDVMRRIWNSAALTLSCQLFTAPVVWVHFHTFPVHFLLTNLIALPVSELLIISGVTCITLHALGIQFAPVDTATDAIARCLEFCLGVIAGM